MAADAAKPFRVGVCTPRVLTLNTTTPRLCHARM
jgi:hypothetical protein